MGRVEHRNLVASTRIGLSISKLAKNSFRSSKVDEGKSDCRREAARLGDGANDVVLSIPS